MWRLGPGFEQESRSITVISQVQYFGVFPADSGLQKAECGGYSHLYFNTLVDYYDLVYRDCQELVYQRVS
jgi:hypothetical protein